MSLYEDWNTYLIDDVFDESHFERLLFENALYKSPDRLFETLPGGKNLCRRLTQLTKDFELRGLYFVASGDANEATQIDRVNMYRMELAKLGATEGLIDDAANLRKAPIKVTRDRSAFDSMTKDRNLARNELPDLLSDLEYDLLVACDSRLLGAQTAILELTKRPEITSWIMAASCCLRVMRSMCFYLRVKANKPYRTPASLFIVSKILSGGCLCGGA